MCACADNQLLDENGTTCTCKFFACYPYCLLGSFWRLEAKETKGIKMRLGTRNSDHYLDIILFRL